MIIVTRLNGTEMCLNPDLILSVESMPDTVITMTTGEKFIVKDSRQEIVNRYLTYKRQIHTLER